jgi:hypothetical protein
MNCETRPKPRTEFSPWFGLFHVNLGCFIDYDIHEFVKALEKTKDRSASFFYALDPSTKNGAGGEMCEGANVDASAKGNPFGSLSVLMPRGWCVQTRAWRGSWRYTHNYPTFNAHFYVVVQPNHDLGPL